ncbi:MAG: DUF5103 domain-containing protein [Capnocytophaga sp.]|nr:DUF5103 domain-containing protein [Capnocytophaga sp.]
MKKLIVLYFISIFSGFAQEITEPDYIKTIIFKGQNSDAQFPIVQLGDTFTLSFDDLKAEETDYYYTITHCDYSWKPSQLLKSEYLIGIDDTKITNYTNSYGTLQPYTNYQLTLPNDDVSFRLTGNYILSITDAQQNIIFTRRFIVYSNSALVQLSVHQSRDMKFSEEKQSVQFKISSKYLQFQNPDTNVKVCILQNYRWNSAITNIKPQFFMGNDLVYKYDKETSFYGGNEYLYFENRDLRVPTTGVINTERIDNEYFSVLFTNAPRAGLPYTYNPDIDGDFRIVTDHGTKPASEAEYSQVEFSLAPKDYHPDDEIYVYGLFSNNQLSPKYQLFYDAQKEIYRGKVYLKQGFYNYKFAVKRSGKEDYNAIGGNHYQTENNYTIIVYYRPIGELYDKVIGVGSLNSTQVSR